MNKMLRNIIIMAAVVVLAVLAFIFVPKLKPATVAEISPEPTRDMTELLLSEHSLDDLDKVILEYDGEKTVVIYDEATETYMVEGYEDRSLDQTSARNIFYTASYVSAEDIVSEDLSDISQFGLDNPVSKVTAKFKDGSDNVFLFGSNVPGSGQYYMIKEGVDKVFVVWNNYGNNAKLKLDNLIELDTQGFILEELSIIRINKDNEVYMEFTNMSGNTTIIDMGSWKLTQPYYRSINSTGEDNAYYDMAEDILSLNPDNILSSKGDDAKYGLDTPWVVIDLVPLSGEQFSILIGDKIDNKYSMKFSTSDIIYVINENQLSFLDNEPIDLVERLLMLINIKYVSKIEMTGVVGNNTLIVTTETKKDEEGKVKLDGNGNPLVDIGYIVDGITLTEDETEQGSFFYQTILSAKVTREADKDYKPGQPVGKIKLELNTEPNEYLIEFYNYDDYFYAVKFQENDIFLIVNKNDINIIPESYELLREREMERP